jgi:putative oxidoreductase
MSSLLRTTPDRQASIALALVRALTGIIFIAHGAQKLFVFGLAGVSGGFAQMGIPMPGVVGPFIALLEFFGGIALVFGLLTRLASLGLLFNMLGAILLVHLKNGFFMPQGYEFPLLLLTTSAALVVAGAGRFSIDSVLAGRTSAATETALPEAEMSVPRRRNVA